MIVIPFSSGSQATESTGFREEPNAHRWKRPMKSACWNRSGFGRLAILAVWCSESVAVAQTTEYNNDSTFLDGGIITRRNVREFADLSLDIRDLRTQSSDPSSMLDLYRNGLHAEYSSGTLLTLKYLSDYFSHENILLTPNFLYHIYGLTIEMPATQDLSTRMADKQHYASALIEKVIQGPHAKYAADAVLANSVWIYATHLLYEAVHLCQERTLADNPDVLDEITQLDEFIALYIGRDQTPGTKDGHSLYAWAQEIGEYFGTTDPEAQVNTNIKLLYQQGVGALALSSACTSQNEQTVKQLWNVVTQITHEMTKPLYQWFLYHLTIKSEGAVDIYANALLPQLSKCRPSVYKRLSENLRNGVQFDNRDSIFRDIEETYACFSISCHDVTHFSESSNEARCNSESKKTKYDLQPPTLAGFKTTSPVAALSRIDVDIRQMRILSTLGSAEFVKYTYLFGSNSPKLRDSENDLFELISLHQLAVSSLRTQANPIYTDFITYTNHKNYADEAIKELWSGSSKWMDTGQITEALVLTSSFSIVFLEIIRLLNASVTLCKASDPRIGSPLLPIEKQHPLDMAAALLIGSMEGSQLGGSLGDGELIWSIGSARAFQFQRMNDVESAIVNDDLVDLLYAAKGELDGLACDILGDSVTQIVKLMQIGIIQSILKAAVENEGLSVQSNNLSLVEGELFAYSILPIIYAYDDAVANVVREKTEINRAASIVRSEPHIVAKAFGYYAMEYMRVSCSYIGSTSGANPCAEYPSEMMSGTAPSGYLLRSTTSLILLCFVGYRLV